MGFSVLSCCAVTHLPGVRVVVERRKPLLLPGTRLGVHLILIVLGRALTSDLPGGVGGFW